jgi:uncharacterized protein (TIGR02284 family)
MSEDRMTSEGSPAPADKSEGVGRSDAPAAPSIADRGADAAAAAWKTTRDAGLRAGDVARGIAGQTYDVGRRAARGIGVIDSPVATLLVGAAIGYAVAYAVYSSSGPSRRSGDRRSGLDEAIATLNGLIEVSKDGEQGFRTSASGVKSADLKTMFEEAARRCAEGARELQNKVRALGGDPERSGSLTGSVHRGWVNLKSAITGMDELAVLDECERGEDIAKAAYSAALKVRLPPDVRSLIERQYQVVKQNHDRVRDLRNARR